MRERAAVLALLDTKAAPITKLAGLIDETGSALRLLEELSTESQERLFDTKAPGPSLDEYEDRILAWEAAGIRIVTVLDTAYPDNLRLVYDRPPLLFIKGALSADDARSVAVVGTRRATDEGRALARQLSHSLADAGYVVVSGLAAGIDTAAHTAALEAGGRTVAVIGTGHDEYFPPENAGLQRRLASESAVISQFLPDQGARKWTFPARNAVMSGFARATAVVEASHTSGARMQARLALEHGRPVFLLRSLMSHEWAKTMARRPGVHVVDTATEIIGTLDRLYSDDLTLIG